MPHTTTKNQRTKRVDTRPNEVTGILIWVLLLDDDDDDDKVTVTLLYNTFCRKYGEC